MNPNKLIQAAMQQQPQGVQIASPMNDVQLVSLVAAQITHEPPAEAVARAMEIVAEAIVQMQGTALSQLVQAKAAFRREIN